ncbi:hypothetical protein [Halobellus sp. H-GB7]|uniref:hypothetical protein n=1 Tax=Halobellus sp. H-GB7 TaxID=3069756 RepID=UPI0027AFE2D0|nr:hypothetical protein [Halobellus sp. H-GB7]MDQ2053253.1 hypothetical protein [Halobellus sp. H-GB7]
MSSSRPHTPGTRVIVPHTHRPLLGRIVDAEMRPTFADPGRTILTVEADDLEETVRVLAQDAEVVADTDTEAGTGEPATDTRDVL